MSHPLRWSMSIQWSEEDDAFLVSLPEWDERVVNPVTHGSTYEIAVANGKEVLEMLVGLYIEQGRDLPAPRIVAAVD